MTRIFVLGIRGFPNVQGGAEKHCEELYPRLAALGLEITVFARTPYIRKEDRVPEWKNVKFVYLWCPKFKYLEAITHTFLAVLYAIRKRPDIVIFQNIGPALFIVITKFFRIKSILVYHSQNYKHQKWGKLAKFILKSGERMGIYFADCVITISKTIKKVLEDEYKKEVVYIPNGVSIPDLVPPGHALKTWQLEPRRYIFTACRFVPEKGLHDLIEAYRMIKEPKFKLVIAGDADHNTEYSRKLKRLASETEGVILTGFVTGSALEELFSNAGLFVLPSYYEGLPIALLEALSYGLPVLVSDIEQHKEIPLEDFRYFKCGDVKALSYGLEESFLRGISDEEKNKYILLLKEQYDWDNIAQKTLEIYKYVMAKNFV